MSPTGVGLHRLRPARILLAFCGLATLALNIAEPFAQRDYGKAAFEVVGPILLVGWSEVGPALLREIHMANTTLPSRKSRAPSPSLPSGPRSPHILI